MSKTDFTPEEEALLTNLFSADLQFTADWRERLTENISARPILTDGDAESAERIHVIDAESATGATDVVVPIAARKSRHLVLLAAAVMAVLVGVGITRLGVGNGTSPQPEVLDPASFVSSPNVAPVALPAGVSELHAASDGAVVGVAASTGDQPTTLLITRDGTEWSELAELPVSDALVDLTTDRWVVVGGTIDTTRTSVESLDPLQVPTQLSIYTSTDDGQTWQSTSYDPAPSGHEFLHVVPAATTVAVNDGNVYVGIELRADVDLTTRARELGLVGPTDRVIRAAVTDTSNRPYSIGPEVVGELAEQDFGAAELGISFEEYGDLMTADSVLSSSRTSQTQPFDLIEVTTDGVMNRLDRPGHSGTTYYQPPELYVAGDNVYGTRFGTGGPDTWVLVDNGEWERTDRPAGANAIVVDRGDWKIAQSSESRSGIVTSTDGGESYQDLPSPESGLRPNNAFETIDGAAITWTQLPPEVLSLSGVNLTENGYRFEWINDQAVSVTRNGETVVESYRDSNGPQANILRDHLNRLVILDETTGDAVAVIDDAELLAAVNATGPLNQNPFKQFVTWSTDGVDWNFTSLSNLGPGAWTAIPIGAEGEFLLFDSLLGNPTGYVVGLPFTE